MELFLIFPSVFVQFETAGKSLKAFIECMHLLTYNSANVSAFVETGTELCQRDYLHIIGIPNAPFNGWHILMFSLPHYLY